MRKKIFLEKGPKFRKNFREIRANPKGLSPGVNGPLTKQHKNNVGHHMWAPKRGRDTPTATAIGANLDNTIIAAFPHGRLSQGGRVPSPDRSRGTTRCRKSAQFSRSSWISCMPVRPAPAPARAAFTSNVPSGLTSRALAWGAVLSGRCPSRVAGFEWGAKMRINAVRGQSRSERTNTVAGRSYTNIMDVCIANRRAGAIGTGRDLQRCAALVMALI